MGKPFRVRATRKQANALALDGLDSHLDADRYLDLNDVDEMINVLDGFRDTLNEDTYVATSPSTLAGFRRAISDLMELVESESR